MPHIHMVTGFVRCGNFALFRELIQKAEEKTGGRPDGELQEKLSALPDDEEELQQEMLKLRAEADGIACANPRVVSIYIIDCTVSRC